MMNNCLNMLLDLGVKDGFLEQPKFIFIPEVMILAPKLCPQIYHRIIQQVNCPISVLSWMFSGFNLSAWGVPVGGSGYPKAEGRQLYVRQRNKFDYDGTGKASAEW